MSRFIEFERHFEQHLIVEKWSKNRGYFIEDAPDFVDYLTRFGGSITNYRELDFYYAWFKQ